MPHPRLLLALALPATLTVTARAAELVSMLEPNIVVPMHYQLPGLAADLEPIDRFLKEMGVTDPKREISLKVASLDSLPQETEVVILSHKQ